MSESMQKALSNEEIPTVECLHRIAKRQEAWSEHVRAEKNSQLMEVSMGMERQLGMLVRNQATASQPASCC